MQHHFFNLFTDAVNVVIIIVVSAKTMPKYIYFHKTKSVQKHASSINTEFMKSVVSGSLFLNTFLYKSWNRD